MSTIWDRWIYSPKKQWSLWVLLLLQKSTSFFSDPCGLKESGVCLSQISRNETSNHNGTQNIHANFFIFLCTNKQPALWGPTWCHHLPKSTPSQLHLLIASQHFSASLSQQQESASVWGFAFDLLSHFEAGRPAVCTMLSGPTAGTGIRTSHSAEQAVRSQDNLEQGRRGRICAGNGTRVVKNGRGPEVCFYPIPLKQF